MSVKDRNTYTWLTGDLTAQLLIFFGVAGVYFWSMPRTVVLEDDGLFLLTAYFNGIAHPPGYPLFTLLSHVATWIPFGSIAARVHGFTAVLGALGCVCLYQVIRQLLPGTYHALVASFAFGFSLAFWSQSIIADVYSLNVLIVLVLLRLSLLYAGTGDTRRQQGLLNWMGLVYGLGLSNHWPLLVLSTPLFLSVLMPHWRNVLRQFPRGTVFGLLGLTPYLWMVWRSQMDPLISFYGPINDWQEFWFIVSREMYGVVEQSQTADWHDKLEFISFTLAETARQFTWAGMVLVITGFLSQWRRFPWQVSTGLSLGYLGNTFVLIGLLGMDYDYFNQANFRALPLVAYAVCAIWLTLGLKLINESLSTHLKNLVRPEMIRNVAGVLVISMPLMTNTADNYRAQDSWTEDYSRVILQTLGKNAVLFTFGDTSVWTIGYVHHVLGIRPDVTLYNMKGTVFSNRLFKPYTLPYPEVEKKLEQLVRSTSNPVYFTSHIAGNFGETDFGLYKLANKLTGKEYQQAVVLPEIRQYFDRLLARGEPYDSWEKMHFRILTASNCLQSVRIARSMSQDTVNFTDQREWIDRICNTFQGKMLYIGYLLNQDIASNELAGLLEDAEKLRYQAIAKSELKQLEEYKERIRQRVSR